VLEYRLDLGVNLVFRRDVNKIFALLCRYAK